MICALQQIRRFLLLLFPTDRSGAVPARALPLIFFRDRFPDLTFTARAAESAPDIVMVK